MLAWEEKLSNKKVRYTFLRKFRRSLLEFLDTVPHPVPSNVLNAFLMVLGKLPNPGNSHARHVLTRLYSTPKLTGEPVPITICIFTAEKDLEILELCLLGALSASHNPINEVRVVAPGYLGESIENLFTANSGQVSLRFQSDEELLDKYGLDSYRFVRPNIKMEILKVLAGIDSDTDGVLLLDGDTVLLSKRCWITRKEQVVLVAQEYTSGHISFDEEYLGKVNLSGLGFVTHHQILRREHLLELVLMSGSLETFVERFNAAAARYYEANEDIFPSEWQLFADYVMEFHPESVKLTSFKNLGMSRYDLDFFLPKSEKAAATQLQEMRNLVPSLASISFHGYKD